MNKNKTKEIPAMNRKECTTSQQKWSTANHTANRAVQLKSHLQKNYNSNVQLFVQWGVFPSRERKKNNKKYESNQP